VLGVDEPLREFDGRLIAVIHRFDDNEDKWVVCPDHMSFTEEEIKKAVAFQEQYFKTEIRSI
jgi:inorganic pyrophosphatase